MMLVKAGFCCFLLVYIQGIRSSTTQVPESLRLPAKGDGCNVVNLQCGAGQQQTGPPGLMGPVGPIGPKGETGIQGAKGESGKNAEVEEMKTDILGMLSVKSCKELAEEHGITTSGHYLLKSTSGSPVYTYCGFQVYSDVSTCEELQARHSLIQAGYFRFGRSTNEQMEFRFCEPIFRDIYTCRRLQVQHGVDESGFYQFASGENEPFKVYCNFTSGSAVTEIHHNLMKEMQIPDCEERGCYSGMPLYDVEAGDIRRIIDNSVSCKQFIKLRCRGVLIKLDSEPYAWWHSHSGQQMLYWGGSIRNGYCACGETNTCVDKSKKCNCDNNSVNLVTSDEGYLTDKSKLPIKEVRVGDMGGWNEIGWHTIGKLECIGQG